MRTNTSLPHTSGSSLDYRGGEQTGGETLSLGGAERRIEWTSRAGIVSDAWHAVEAPPEDWRQALKRTFDLVTSLLFLVLLMPLALVVAFAIKLDSPGPVFFSQPRMGRGGERFPAFKFRTMHVDAAERLRQILLTDKTLKEEYDKYHKLREDPRVTTVGRFLRKYSLDELPQLANVVLGHMSLVGPRAYLPEELPTMEGKEKVILLVRPGITGFWQAGGRNSVPFEERLDMDIFYISNWSLGWDVFLLVCTARLLLRESSAY